MYVTARIAGRGRLALADALDRKRRRLSTAGVILQLGGGRLSRRIDQIEGGDIPGAGKLRRVGQPEAFILGRLARHGGGTFGHFGNGAVGNVRGRDTGLPLTDQHAQPDLHPLRPLGLFQPAAPHIDGDRCPVHGNRIGPIRPGLRRRRQKRVCQMGKPVGHRLVLLWIGPFATSPARTGVQGQHDRAREVWYHRPIWLVLRQKVF